MNSSAVDFDLAMGASDGRGLPGEGRGREYTHTLDTGSGELCVLYNVGV